MGIAKDQLKVAANGLGEKCTVITELPILGKQKVCV